MFENFLLYNFRILSEPVQMLFKIEIEMLFVFCNHKYCEISYALISTGKTFKEDRFNFLKFWTMPFWNFCICAATNKMQRRRIELNSEI